MTSRPVIKSCTMGNDDQEYAIRIAQDAILSTKSEQDIASLIKQEFERTFGRTWHCFVGRNFACYVTHESKCFIYFYIGQIGVCLFATD
ncbi:Dnl2 protein-like protein [Pelagophyceae sp. CCMP2097]|nr:Dnl2 protein-like protein [Pelagophyceae sp. CCMP2097]